MATFPKVAVEPDVNVEVKVDAPSTPADGMLWWDTDDATPASSFELFYPIGAIYQSTVATSPATLFGFGTWTSLAGKFLVGKDTSGTFGTAGATGGSETHLHDDGTLYTTVELFNSGGTNYLDAKLVTGSNTYVTTNRFYSSGSTSALTETQDKGIDVLGNTGTSSSLPPYKVVYMWERTA